MSKFYGIAGKRKGSVGNETYAMTPSDNVVKAKIIKNGSKTPEQVIQRSKLQNCVKAYNQIGTDFFKGCFNITKKGNSVYNQFVKANAKNGSPLHKQYSNDPAIIGIGAKTIANGPLSGLDFTKFYLEEEAYFGLKLASTVAVDGSATVGDVSSALLANFPNLKEGDFINFGGLFNKGVAFQEDVDAPLSVQQDHLIDKKLANFKINSSDTSLIKNKGFHVFKAHPDLEEEQTQVVILVLGNHPGADDSVHSSFYANSEEIGYCFCVVARKEGNKILTSKSHIFANAAYTNLITFIEQNPFRQNGWLTTLVKIAILTSYLAGKIKEIIQDWPI